MTDEEVAAFVASLEGLPFEEQYEKMKAFVRPDFALVLASPILKWTKLHAFDMVEVDRRRNEKCKP